MARTKRPIKPTCVWSDEGSDGEYYSPGCDGPLFCFNEHVSPKEAGFVFCPYCGCALKADRKAAKS